jgi:Nucleotidyl transferase AbiEii toxin, Type IV TA system
MGRSRAIGDANTRDRDYGDVYLLSEIHAIDAESLRQALREVAEHRWHDLRPLGPQLEALRQTRQQPWAAFRARVGLVGLPERFSEVVDRVIEIVDGMYDWGPLVGVSCPRRSKGRCKAMGARRSVVTRHPRASTQSSSVRIPSPNWSKMGCAC